MIVKFWFPVREMQYGLSNDALHHTDGATDLKTRKENHMLYTIEGILGVLWLLGLVTGYTAGYFIHILLVVAVVMVLLNLFQGRRSV